MKLLYLTAALLTVISGCEEGIRSLVYTDSKCQNIDWKASKMANAAFQKQINGEVFLVKGEERQIKCTAQNINFFKDEMLVKSLNFGCNQVGSMSVKFVSSATDLHDHHDHHHDHHDHHHHKDDSSHSHDHKSHNGHHGKSHAKHNGKAHTPCKHHGKKHMKHHLKHHPGTKTTKKTGKK